MAKIQFTAAGPGAGPNRGINGLNFDVPVGYPVWLWAEGGNTDTRTVTDSVGGIGVNITVDFDNVTFDMGDGTTVTCAGKGTKWVKGVSTPGAPSPTCSHVYEDMGRYTITATTNWTTTWTAGGQSGTEAMAISQDRPWAVGEIQTIIQ